MEFDSGEAFAKMLHLRAHGLRRGDPVAPPIVPASTYFLPETPEGPHQYGRWTNPIWTLVEDALAALENAEVVAFPSGMAAIAAVFLSQLRPGDRLLLPSDGYYTSRAVAERYLVPSGVRVEHAATPGVAERDFSGLRMVLVETPSNPMLDLCDVSLVAERARAAGALVVVDNTTMTPLGQRPLDLGADVVVAADTKAPNGHSDALFGHVASRDPAVMQAVREWRKLVGAIPGQFEAWLVHRGLETLEVRFERMCASAQVVAERLAAHRGVRGVVYPGLPSHPAHELAGRQMRKFGSLIGMDFPDAAAAERFIAGCRYIVPATSFGGIHTSAERRARWGDAVADGYVRLSIGCEPTEALWAEMARALDELAC